MKELNNTKKNMLLNVKQCRITTNGVLHLFTSFFYHLNIVFFNWCNVNQQSEKLTIKEILLDIDCERNCFFINFFSQKIYNGVLMIGVNKIVVHFFKSFFFTSKYSILKIILYKIVKMIIFLIYINGKQTINPTT